MELGTFTPRPREEMTAGDKLQAQQAIDKVLVAFVREHKSGIKTKFNQDPAEKGYKPEGADGVVVDVADVVANEVFIDVLWLNGAIVDNLSPYVGQAVPIKLVWTASASGGKPFIGVQGLEGAQLQQAQQWASANPARFDTERAQRASNAAAFAAEQPVTPAPLTPVAMAPAAPAPAAAPAAPAPAPAAAPAMDPNDPAIAQLLAQLAAQQQPAAS
jgi:hypothetical protein